MVTRLRAFSCYFSFSYSDATDRPWAQERLQWFVGIRSLPSSINCYLQCNSTLPPSCVHYWAAKRGNDHGMYSRFFSLYLRHVVLNTRAVVASRKLECVCALFSRQCSVDVFEAPTPNPTFDYVSAFSVVKLSEPFSCFLLAFSIFSRKSSSDAQRLLSYHLLTPNSS